MNFASTPKFNGYKSSDMHAWVVLENGKIMDYPTKLLKSQSMLGTDELKYVAFDDKHQQKLNDIYTEKFNQQLKLGIERKIVETTYITTPGYCQFRSIIIHNKLKEKGIKSKIVFGSLGFIQGNGSVFYEYG